MKRFTAALGLLLALCSIANARQLVRVVPTTAVTAQVSIAQQTDKGASQGSVTLQANFVYGSGGTSADAWVQTSLDGLTWTDVANFHFTTASARFIFNLSSLTPVTTEYVPTDGTLASNTSKDGIVGPWWRVKYTTVGTYAGTTMTVDLAGQQIR